MYMFMYTYIYIDIHISTATSAHTHTYIYICIYKLPEFRPATTAPPCLAVAPIRSRSRPG